MRWRRRWHRTYSAHSCACEVSVNPLDAESRTDARTSCRKSAWHIRTVTRLVERKRTMKVGHPGPGIGLHCTISIRDVDTLAHKVSHTQGWRRGGGEEVVGGRRGLEGMEVCVCHSSLSLFRYVCTHRHNILW